MMFSLVPASTCSRNAARCGGARSGGGVPKDNGLGIVGRTGDVLDRTERSGGWGDDGNRFPLHRPQQGYSPHSVVGPAVHHARGQRRRGEPASVAPFGSACASACIAASPASP